MRDIPGAIQMNNQQSITALCLLTLAASQTLAEPDLIVSDITSATTFGSVDDKIAYSFGTTICNIGDSEAAWIDGTNQNPLISQTLYRLADGQIQQLGIGFAHYATPPLSANACGLGCTPAGFNALGAGCSTTSSAAIHGLQATLGPRTEIDPYTGDYPYPFTSIGQTGDAIYKRLQVNIADISDPSDLYFVETQIITSAETTPQTRANNVSYRQVTFAPGSATATVIGPTYTEQPAIFAWRDHGNGIGIPDPSVLIAAVTIPQNGIIHIASKCTAQDNGDWRYDYALHNQNASKAPANLNHSIGMLDDTHSYTFDGVSYHDDIDELIDPTQWNVLLVHCESIANWTPDEWHLFLPSMNSVRWGTTYTFSFQTAQEPDILGLGDISINYLSKDSFSYLPLEGMVGPTLNDFPCIPGCTIADIAEPYGTLNFFDVSAFLSAFASQDPAVDFALPSGSFDFFDVSAFLSSFSAGCP